MAEIVLMDGNGRRKGSGVSGVGGAGKAATRRDGNTARKTGSKTANRRGGERKARKRKVKGYGVDLLRTAAERRMAESSKELAETLVAKALEGKMDSVKMLMKLAEEEKVRRLEVIDEEGPNLAEVLIGSTAKIGQVWDGQRWKRLRRGKIVEGEPERAPMSLGMELLHALVDNGDLPERALEDDEGPEGEPPAQSRPLLGSGREEGRE